MDNGVLFETIRMTLWSLEIDKYCSGKKFLDDSIAETDGIFQALLKIDYTSNFEVIIALTYEYSVVTVFAIILIMYNLLFKLTAAPFHF